MTIQASARDAVAVFRAKVFDAVPASWRDRLGGMWIIFGSETKSALEAPPMNR